MRNQLLEAAIADAQRVEKARQRGLLPSGGSQRYSGKLNSRISRVRRLENVGKEIFDESYPSSYTRTQIGGLPGGGPALRAIGAGLHRLSVRLQRPSGKYPFKISENGQRFESRLGRAADYMQARAERNAFNDRVGFALTGGAPSKPKRR